MDPKLSGLDPKLQDAYDRVMNGPSTLPGQTPAPANPPTASQQTEQHNPMQPPTQPSTQQPPVHPSNQFTSPNPINPTSPIPPSASGFQTTPPAPESLNLDNQLPPAPLPTQPVDSSQLPNVDPTPAINSTMAFNANNSDINKGTSGEKGKKNMLPIIIGIFIPIFLVVYAIVWMVIFKVQLPFMN